MTDDLTDDPIPEGEDVGEDPIRILEDDASVGHEPTTREE
jgi:hypothetical protein